MTTTIDGVHTSNVTLLAEDLVLTQQSCEYTNLITCSLRRNDGGAAFERFRVLIRRDSHEFQSYARVEVWRRDGWTTVHFLRGEDERVSGLPTKYAAVHDEVGAREQFGDLSSDLLDLATRVVA